MQSEVNDWCCELAVCLILTLVADSKGHFQDGNSFPHCLDFIYWDKKWSHGAPLSTRGNKIRDQVQKWTRQRGTELSIAQNSTLFDAGCSSFRRNQQNPVCVFRPSEAAAQASEGHLQLRGGQPGRADLQRGRGDRGGRRGGPGVVGQYLRHTRGSVAQDFWLALLPRQLNLEACVSSLPLGSLLVWAATGWDSFLCRNDQI